MHRSSYFAIPVAAVVGFSANAHHSIAGMYHRDQQVTVSGAIAEFRFVQPHPFIVLEADTGTAEPQRWHLELDNHRELVQLGVTEDTFRPGDEVVVTGDRARDGDDRLYIRLLERSVDGFRYEAPGFRPSISTAADLS